MTTSLILARKQARKRKPKASAPPSPKPGDLKEMLINGVHEVRQWVRCLGPTEEEHWFWGRIDLRQCPTCKELIRSMRPSRLLLYPSRSSSE